MMIKHLRRLTQVLGKLGINRLKRESWEWDDYLRHKNAGSFKAYEKTVRIPERYTYGWGLKESKDFVENYLDRKARTTTT